jgi:hypothetical protein
LNRADELQEELGTAEREQDHENDLEKHLSRRSTRRRYQIEHEKYPETDLDKGIIGWDGQDDPANPKNFPDFTKWCLLGLVSAITLTR